MELRRKILREPVTSCPSLFFTSRICKSDGSPLRIISFLFYILSLITSNKEMDDMLGTTIVLDACTVFLSNKIPVFILKSLFILALLVVVILTLVQIFPTDLIENLVSLLTESAGIFRNVGNHIENLTILRLVSAFQVIPRPRECNN